MSESILDEEEKDYKPKRNKKGQFRKGSSGFPSGRPSGSTNKINKQKIVTAFNKDLLKTLHKILALGDKAAEDGQIASALKAYSFFAEKGLQVLAQQDKLAAEMEKLRKKGEEEVDPEDSKVEEAIFEWNRYSDTGTDN